MTFDLFLKDLFPKVRFSIEDKADLRISFDKVYKFFEQNETKTRAWFVTDNMNFGGTSAFRLILLGKAKRVRQFVDSRIDENRPPEDIS